MASMFISQLLIICYVGETLINASLEITDALESSRYEDFVDDIKSLKFVGFILLRSQRPLRIAVGCAGSMNLQFFTETMNKLISILMILKTFMME